MSVEQTRNAWYFAGLSVSGLLVLVIVLYRQTVLYLAGLWNNFQIGEYGHGYLVLAISVFLIVRNRRRLASLTPGPNYWALPAVMASCLLWLVAVLVDVNMVQAVGLLFLVAAIVWTMLGTKVASALMFPVLFVGFAIPVWFPLSPLLQNLTADMVFWGIRLLEVPAFRQENMIIVPAGKLSIEEACSGLRYLLAALTLGTLYAYLNYETFRARLLVVVISAAAALLANLLRVSIVVYLGYATEMQHPLVHDHLMLGWYLFGGLVALLLFVDTKLYRRYQQSNIPDEPGQSGIQRQAAKPVASAREKRRYLGVLAGTALIVSVGPAVVYAVNHMPRAENADAEIRLPPGSGGWSGPVAGEDDWAPVFHGATVAKQHYEKNKDQIIVYIGHYKSQRQGEELINDLNRINNKKVWQTVYPRARPKSTSDGRVLEQLLQKSNGDRKLVWYWYRVAGRETTNRYEAKVLQLVGLLKRDTRASIIAIAADANEDVASARELLGDFVGANEELLTQHVAGIL